VSSAEGRGAISRMMAAILNRTRMMNCGLCRRSRRHDEARSQCAGVSNQRATVQTPKAMMIVRTIIPTAIGTTHVQAGESQ
jgi:hypothetical protein